MLDECVPAPSLLGVHGPSMTSSRRLPPPPPPQPAAPLPHALERPHRAARAGRPRDLAQPRLPTLARRVSRFLRPSVRSLPLSHTLELAFFALDDEDSLTRPFLAASCTNAISKGATRSTSRGRSTASPTRSGSSSPPLRSLRDSRVRFLCVELCVTLTARPRRPPLHCSLLLSPRPAAPGPSLRAQVRLERIRHFDLDCAVGRLRRVEPLAVLGLGPAAPGGEVVLGDGEARAPCCRTEGQRGSLMARATEWTSPAPQKALLDSRPARTDSPRAAPTRPARPAQRTPPAQLVLTLAAGGPDAVVRLVEVAARRYRPPSAATRARRSGQARSTTGWYQAVAQHAQGILSRAGLQGAACTAERDGGSRSTRATAPSHAATLPRCGRDECRELADLRESLPSRSSRSCPRQRGLLPCSSARALSSVSAVERLSSSSQRFPWGQESCTDWLHCERGTRNKLTRVKDEAQAAVKRDGKEARATTSRARPPLSSGRRHAGCRRRRAGRGRSGRGGQLRRGREAVLGSGDEADVQEVARATGRASRSKE